MRCSVCRKELGKTYLGIVGNVFNAKDLTSYEGVKERFCSVECYLVHKSIEAINRSIEENKLIAKASASGT